MNVFKDSSQSNKNQKPLPTLSITKRMFCILGKPEIQATVKGKMQRGMGKSQRDWEEEYEQQTTIRKWISLPAPQLNYRFLISIKMLFQSGLVQEDGAKVPKTICWKWTPQSSAGNHLTKSNLGEMTPGSSRQIIWKHISNYRFFMYWYFGGVPWSNSVFNCVAYT